MSKLSNNLQKWISKNDSDAIEKSVRDLELKYPIELVVAFTDKPAVVPFSAARMIALLAVVIELLCEAFWIPIPSWVLGMSVFFVLMLPSAQWQALGLFRLLRLRDEREQAVMAQAQQCFSDLGLARTRARNALLVFFNMKERLFFLQPDPTLASEWPDLKMSELVADLHNQLTAQAPPAQASLQLLERISALAEKRWQDAQPKLPADELPNGVAWWQPSSTNN